MESENIIYKIGFPFGFVCLSVFLLLFFIDLIKELIWNSRNGKVTERDYEHY
jgi:hypothetical protein